MGPGGIIVLLLLAGTVSYILLTEKTFQKKPASGGNPFDEMPKISVQLVKAPQELTERLTPKWQAEITQQLAEEGYLLLGDYSYASTLFFWARTFLAPDSKSTLILANWVEGKEGGKVVISNLEIYSFTGNSSLRHYRFAPCGRGCQILLTGGQPAPRKSKCPFT